MSNNRVEELVSIIKKAQNDYYNGTPSMTDSKFDSLWDELKQLDPNNEILTKKIGSDSSSVFKKAQHQILMGSQSKVNSKEEVEEFLKTIKGAVTVGDKLDGISLELNYTKGNLISAITRGDGQVGDDITSNVMKVPNVPKTLKSDSFTGAVRGEILLSRANKKEYFPEAKNCRNQANGIAKRIDGTDSDKLSVVTYDVEWLDFKDNTFTTDTDKLDFLKDNGFTVVNYKVFEDVNAENIMSFLKDRFNKFDSLEYDIDGVVIKQNTIDFDDLKECLRPKTQVALKPKNIRVETEITGFEWNVKNGTITPVALFKPVDIQGSTVSRASCYNVNFLEYMKLEVGDKVIITKFNMIIPGILENVTKETFNQEYVD